MVGVSGPSDVPVFMVRWATLSTDACLRKAKLDLKPASPAPSSTQEAARSAESERDTTDGDEAAREGDETPIAGDESARPTETWLPSSALSCDLMQLLRSCVCVKSRRIQLSLVQTTPHAHGQGATYRMAIYEHAHTHEGRAGLGQETCRRSSSPAGEWWLLVLRRRIDMDWRMGARKRASPTTHDTEYKTAYTLSNAKARVSLLHTHGTRDTAHTPQGSHSST